MNSLGHLLHSVSQGSHPLSHSPLDYAQTAGLSEGAQDCPLQALMMMVMLLCQCQYQYQQHRS